MLPNAPVTKIGLSKLTKALFWGAFVVGMQGCYTLQQGYYQVELLFKRRAVQDVLRTANEKQERLAKLQVVSDVLDFAQQHLGLHVGKNYRSYVALEGSAVTYVVQAAYKNKLEFKTWWFPLVGSQPYLGFFKRQDAVAFRDKLTSEGWDTTLGGVQAFSLLGYFPDPIYSSMLDGNTLPEFVELLFHESLHATLYIPNFTAFNENLADFVAKQGVSRFFAKHPELGVDVSAYLHDFQKTLFAQKRFKTFLLMAKQELRHFYNETKLQGADFIAAREKIFEELASRYVQFMAGAEKDTRYAFAFQKGKLNNAVILGYSLYEAKQEPFEAKLLQFNGDLLRFMRALKACLSNFNAAHEEAVWQRVSTCEGD